MTAAPLPELDLDGGGNGTSVIRWHRVKAIVGADYMMIAADRPTGFWVRHCGHPTANRPYYILTPADNVLERKYRLVVDAKAATIATYQEL